jgi:hypothetical protein
MKRGRLQNELLTPELKARFKELGRQKMGNPIMVAKFDSPLGIVYMTEYSEETGICYGYFTMVFSRFLTRAIWNYSTLEELKALKFKRDSFFKEVSFSKLKI